MIMLRRPALLKATFLLSVFLVSLMVVVALPIKALVTVDLSTSVSSESQETATSSKLDVIGALGGAADVVAVQGDYAYITGRKYLNILDISQPERPVKVGSVTISYISNEPVFDVVISGSFAYVATTDGMTVIDISRPTDPFVVNHYDPGFYAVMDIEIVGDYAYLIVGGDLSIVDISNPGNPDEVGVFTPADGSDAFGVAVVGNFAYLAGETILRIVDVSDRANPFERGSYDDSDGGIGRSVIVDDNYALVAGTPTLQIVDVSDVDQLERIGAYTEPSDDGFYHFGGSISSDGEHAFVTWEHNTSEARQGVLSINLQDPKHPSRDALFDWVFEATDTSLVGDKLFVAYGDAGLKIIDVSNPARPSEISFFGTVGFVYEAVPNGGHVVLATLHGLVTVDVTNPTRPTVAGILPIPSGISSVTVDGDYVYTGAFYSSLINGIQENTDGMLIVDVSAPENPIPRGLLMMSPPADIAIAGTFAYASDYGGELIIIDISDPDHPYKTGSTDVSGAPHELQVVGDYAYIASNEVILSVVDVSDPRNPREQAIIEPEAGFGHGVDVANGYAFIAAGSLLIIDVRDADNLHVVQEFDMPYGIYDVEVLGRYAFVGASQGMRVLDISDPEKPVELIDPGRRAGLLHGDDNYVYAANYSEGFQILRFVDGRPAVEVNERVSGTIRFDEFEEWCGEDVWRFAMPGSGSVLLNANIEPVGGIGYVCLEGDDVSECVPNSWPNSGHDILLYRSLAAGYYTIRVVGDWSEHARPVCFNYQLTLSSPVLVSATEDSLENDIGYVDGIEFTSGDIMAHSALSNGEEQWVKLFDASDVGITGDVSNIAAEGGNHDWLLLSLNEQQSLPGVGIVTPWDFIVFDPDQLGEDTVGTFRWGLKGKDHELTTNGERLDGLDGWVYGYETDPNGHGCFGYPISTMGNTRVQTWGSRVLKQGDEDVFCKVYDDASGGWRPFDYFFDVKGLWNAPPSEPAPGQVRGLARRDVTALAYDDTDDRMYLTIRGNGLVSGSRVTQRDIFRVDYPSYKWGGVVWHGPDHGWRYAIDAIELNGW